MNENNNNWFYRNRTFLFGFTAVLIVLYIVISMLVPHQTPVAWSGEATEYAVNDEDFAEVHTVALEGTLTSSVIGGTRFDGTLTISGYDELDLSLIHIFCRVCASNCSASSARRRRVSSKQTSASSSTTGVSAGRARRHTASRSAR